MNSTRDLLLRARLAMRKMSSFTSEERNSCLKTMADCILEDTEKILLANRLDLEKANMSSVMLDRLLLTEDRIKNMALGIRNVSELPDPLITIEEKSLPNGLKLKKQAVPMGVIAIIYESRPNVTSDAAALCLKSGNVSVLRCGKEAHESAMAITASMKRALVKEKFPEDSITLIEDTSRASANEIMKARGLIDLLIPRGGRGLIQTAVSESLVPVIETGTGICHIYCEKSCDKEKALDIIENAKCQRPSVCNACECVLVDREIAEEFLPSLYERLVNERIKNKKTAVRLNVCPESFGILMDYCRKNSIGSNAENYIFKAKDEDFHTEYLDFILSVKTVAGITEAIEHIEEHSTRHSEAILTSSPEAFRIFSSSVDSAALYLNASTRFTDGGEFGLGCEMGISTQKLHARGPMGLSELCTYKYIIEGNYNIR